MLDAGHGVDKIKDFYRTNDLDIHNKCLSSRDPSCHPFVEPVRVLDARHGVGQALHGGGDGDDLLDRAPQPLPVVVKVHQVPDVRHLVRASPYDRAQ